MSDLSERLVQAASDAVIAKWWGLMLDGPGPDELEGARFLAESIIPAVLRELAEAMDEADQHHPALGMIGYSHLARLADEIEGV